MNVKKRSLIVFICLTFAGLSNAQSKRKHHRQKPPTTAEVLQRTDTNKDGKVSQQEVQGRLKKDFAKIDANKDGFLSTEELDKVPRPNRKKPPTAAEVLQRTDTNKDGKVSQQEVQGRLKKDFAKIDANKDGFLSTKELDKVPRPNRKKPPTTDEVLKRTDTDKDGKVSQQEAQGRLKKDFAKIDANKDGFLSTEELDKVPRPNRKNPLKKIK